MRIRAFRVGPALAGAVTVAAVGLVLPAAASAGLTEVLIRYDHDAITIPNGHGAAKMTFNVPPPNNRLVGSVSANFRVRHERTQQLKLVLKAPNGDRVLLSDGATHGQNLGDGQCTDDYNHAGYTGFRDTSSAPLATGSPPYTGYWQPAEPLSSLTGISPVGDWTLIVQDTRDAGDPGKLLCGLLLLSLPPP